MTKKERRLTKLVEDLECLVAEREGAIAVLEKRVGGMVIRMLKASAERDEAIARMPNYRRLRDDIVLAMRAEIEKPYMQTRMR